MKKLILFFSALSLVFTSCSSDDDPLPVIEPVVGPINNVVDNGSLLKKITYADGSYDTFTYNGNKIVSIINSDNIENVYYTYTGNNITKAELKDDTGAIIRSVIYTYDANNKVTQELEYDNLSGMGTYIKHVYTYNTDGTIKTTAYSGNASVQSTYAGYDISYFDSNKNVIKFEVFDQNNILSDIETYEVDNKNCPFKNIIGFNKLITVIHSVFGDYNNTIKETYTNVGSPAIVTTYTYTYNSNNYPASSTEGTETETYTYY